MSLWLGCAEQDIRQQLQPFNILSTVEPGVVHLRELKSQAVFILTFADEWLHVEPAEEWVLEALGSNIGHFVQTQKPAFSMGPHAGHMRVFWRESKKSRCN